MPIDQFELLRLGDGTNSETEVQHLNSALVDGESASDFEPTSDEVRLRTTIQVGSEASFDVGLVTFEFSCSTIAAGFQAQLSLLNNAPPVFGNWFLYDATLNDPQVQVRDGPFSAARNETVMVALGGLSALLQTS